MDYPLFLNLVISSRPFNLHPPVFISARTRSLVFVLYYAIFYPSPSLSTPQTLRDDTDNDETIFAYRIKRISRRDVASLEEVKKLNGFCNILKYKWPKLAVARVRSERSESEYEPQSPECSKPILTRPSVSQLRNSLSYHQHSCTEVFPTLFLY